MTTQEELNKYSRLLAELIEHKDMPRNHVLKLTEWKGWHDKGYPLAPSYIGVIKALAKKVGIL